MDVKNQLLISQPIKDKPFRDFQTQQKIKIAIILVPWFNEYIYIYGSVSRVPNPPPWYGPPPPGGGG